MARPLPPPPLNGLAISGGTFFFCGFPYLSIKIDELLAGFSCPADLCEEGGEGVDHVPPAGLGPGLHEALHEVGRHLPGSAAGLVEEDLLQVGDV